MSIHVEKIASFGCEVVLISKIMSHKIFSFPIEMRWEIVECLGMNYRPFVETPHSSALASIRRILPCTIFRFLSVAGSSSCISALFTAIALTKSYCKILSRSTIVAQVVWRAPHCRMHVKFGLKKLGGQANVYRAHWVSRQKSVLYTRNSLTVPGDVVFRSHY